MEVVCKSDYQDIYRIKDGVLLVINKFKNFTMPDGKRYSVYKSDRTNSRRYAKNCQPSLKVLIKDYHHNYEPFYTIPKGTVLYNNTPVKLVEKEEWEYQIKTSGELFSGNRDTINTLLRTIIDLI